MIIHSGTIYFPMNFIYILINLPSSFLDHCSLSIITIYFVLILHQFNVIYMHMCFCNVDSVSNNSKSPVYQGIGGSIFIFWTRDSESLIVPSYGCFRIIPYRDLELHTVVCFRFQQVFLQLHHSCHTASVHLRN